MPDKLKLYVVEFLDADGKPYPDRALAYARDCGPRSDNPLLKDCIAIVAFSSRDELEKYLYAQYFRLDSPYRIIELEEKN